MNKDKISRRKVKSVAEKKKNSDRVFGQKLTSPEGWMGWSAVVLKKIKSPLLHTSDLIKTNSVPQTFQKYNTVRLVQCRTFGYIHMLNSNLRIEENYQYLFVLGSNLVSFLKGLGNVSPVHWLIKPLFQWHSHRIMIFHAMILAKKISCYSERSSSSWQTWMR